MNKAKKQISFSTSVIMLISIALIFFFGIYMKIPTASILLFVMLWLCILALFSGISGNKVEEAFINGAKKGMGAILILLCVGILVSMWIQSGIVPMLVYYGLGLFSPKILLPTSFLLCSILSLCTGSSWGTCGTIGIALVSIGEGMGVPSYIIAGAAISGAVLGDKLSPFSDTTVFASGITGVNIYDHIHSMMHTTIPTFFLALLIYFILGSRLKVHAVDTAEIVEIQETIRHAYTFHWSLFLLPLSIILMGIKKVPAVISLLFCGLLGSVLSIVIQKNSLQQVLETIYSGVEVSLGNEILDVMLSKGGLISMLPTVGIVFLALSIGGLVSEMNILEVLVVQFRDRIQREYKIVLFTIFCGILMVLLLSSLYVSAALIGELFTNFYKERNIDRAVLSRTIEETTTITAPLIPWHSSYMYYTELFHLSGMAFVPYTIFCWLNLIVSIVFTIMERNKLKGS